MPSRSKKPWQRGRKSPAKDRPLRRILILCEDEKSSVLYLEKFPVDKDVVEVDCEGTGKNTDSLMEEAIQRKKQAYEEGRPYQEVWVVFDRDSFPQHNFNRAFHLASSHREVTACWSNECFELWYLLHFQYQNTAMKRIQIFKEVSKKVGRTYQKNDGTIYDTLKDKLETAQKNADRLYQLNERNRTGSDNPSTKVHHLVSMLLKLNPANFDS
ncbi:MAG: RloB domain-containing protein [Opitutales bacterium]|nr:RloB domain-containing protein [Opitutales bacterium]